MPAAPCDSVRTTSCTPRRGTGRPTTRPRPCRCAPSTPISTPARFCAPTRTAPRLRTPRLCAFPLSSGLGGAITGGAFYEGLSYPPVYRGAYFVTDFVTRWIKTITLAPDDSLASITDFASGDSNFRPVDLAPGPDGDLRYLNFASDFTIPSGSVHRIVHVGDGNHAPRPVASAEPASGYAPLSVSFSAAGSTDPDGDPLSCHWLFGDGGEADGCEAHHVYESDGPGLATLRLTDGKAPQETGVK